MLFTLPSNEVLYEALIARDVAYEGQAYVGVTTTGIFCRLTCTARKPNRENCVFYGSVQECLAAGFRPCLRCRPLEALSTAHPVVSQLMSAIEQQPGRRWLESDVSELGLDPSTVRRVFKRHLGVTFLDFARLYRLKDAGELLSRGEPVVDAQIQAGFESASGFRTAFARVLGQSPAAMTGGSALMADWIESPLGPLLTITDQTSLHLLEFFDRKALPAELKKLDVSQIGLGRTAATEQVAAELQAYFKGESATFTTPLAATSTDFTLAVWKALRDIPEGETRSYHQVAAAISRPTSVRAVARANGANQIAIIIPCHRVIGADGDLTGYGGGLWRKRWLIDHERKHFGQLTATLAATP